MKKAIHAWTIPGDVSFEAMFASVSSAGFEGIELNLDKVGSSQHSLTMESGPDVFEHVLALTRQWNLPVCSISTSLYGGTLGSDLAEEREFGKASCACNWRARRHWVPMQYLSCLAVSAQPHPFGRRI